MTRLVVFPTSGIARNGAIAHGTYFRQFGILFDFDAPALVVSQMPMESIHVV